MVSSDNDGQISETSMAVPDAGADQTPGTEEGTPPAADSGHEPHEGPRDYGTTDRTASGEETDEASSNNE